MDADDMLVFGGSGSPHLTRKICDYLQLHPGKGEVLRFSEGNLFVRILENVRGRQVYLVQSTAFPANDNFMELLFWIDAFKRASAASVTAVMPYFSYAKGDKKDEPRVSIRARVCADAIEVAGADRVVTMDLHAPQIQGFFHVPVDDLYAMPVLCDAVPAVAPARSGRRRARHRLRQEGAALCLLPGRAPRHRRQRARGPRRTRRGAGDHRRGRGPDGADGGRLHHLRRHAGRVWPRSCWSRARPAVYAAITHGVFAAGSMERLDGQPDPAPARHRYRRDPARPAVSRRSRSCRSRPSSARRSGASTTAKASASCSPSKRSRTEPRAGPFHPCGSAV